MFIHNRLKLRSVPISAGGRARANAHLHKLGHTRQLQFSAVEGPQEPPLDHRTLPIYFQQEILAKHSTRPALICRQERPRAHAGPPSPNMGVSTHLAWDFEELDRHIRALARGLLELGVKPGERVAVIMGNNRSVHSLHNR